MAHIWQNQTTSTWPSAWLVTGATCTVASTDVWPRWAVQVSNVTASAITNTTVTWQMWGAQRPVTEAEARANMRRLDEHRAESLRIEGERAKARERAVLLLQESLDERQRVQLAEKGYFDLQTIAQNGERRTYRIKRGTHGNIKRIDETGRVLESLCVQPNNVPTEDAMLAQKLWLEANEPELRRVANITRY